jgi:hypothetical protein
MKVSSQASSITSFVMFSFPSKLDNSNFDANLMKDDVSCSMRHVEKLDQKRPRHRNPYKRGRIDRLVFPNRVGKVSSSSSSKEPCAVQSSSGYSRVILELLIICV